MRERDLDVDDRGLRLRVREWGPLEGAATVILHGFAEQAAAWDGVARALARRVVVPDHRGHGLSGHLGAGGFYHFWDYVADLDVLVDDIGAPVDLVGHSMGGTMACYFAACRPEKVRRLVLVEGLGPPDMSAGVVARARRSLDDRRAGLGHRPASDVDAAAGRLRRFNPDLDVNTARRLAARATRPADGGLVWTLDPLHRARAPVPFTSAYFGEFLDEIRAPTLVVLGARSPYGPADLDARLERLRAAAQVDTVTLAGGHHPHHGEPEALVAVIRGHLDG